MESDLIRSKIYEVRGQKVMLDTDLAELYQVETKSLNLAVKRNAKRFPPDFMFQLTDDEWTNLRFQIETSSWGGRRYLPHVFTEQGVAMLSGVLHSDHAIEVNIAIMKTFVMIRQFSLDYKEFAERLKKLENQFTDVYDAIRYLLEKEKSEVRHIQRTRIGFKEYKS